MRLIRCEGGARLPFVDEASAYEGLLVHICRRRRDDGWPHLPKKLVEPSLSNSNGSFWRKAAVSAMRRFFRRRDGRSDRLRVFGGAWL